MTRTSHELAKRRLASICYPDQRHHNGHALTRDNCGPGGAEG